MLERARQLPQPEARRSMIVSGDTQRSRVSSVPVCIGPHSEQCAGRMVPILRGTDH
jgi:hypothetical protein